MYVSLLFLAFLDLNLDFFLAGARFPLLGGLLSAVRIHVLGFLDEIIQLLDMIGKGVLGELPYGSSNPEDPEESVTNSLGLSAQLFVYEIEDEG